MIDTHGKFIASIALIILGVSCALWGDKKLKLKESLIIKILSWPEGGSKFIKWPIAAALIYSGVMIYLH